MRNHHLLGLKELRLRKKIWKRDGKPSQVIKIKIKRKILKIERKLDMPKKYVKNCIHEYVFKALMMPRIPGEKLAFNGLCVFVVVHSRRIAVSYFKMLSVLFQRNIGLRNIFGSINI